MSLTKPLEVVVVGPMLGYGNGDLTGELSQAKAALLYADVVRIESFRPTFLLARSIQQVRSFPERVKFLDYVSKEVGQEVYDELVSRLSPAAAQALEPVLRAVRNGDLRGLVQLPEIISEALRGVKELPSPEVLFRIQAEFAVDSWVKFKPDERNPRSVQAVQDLLKLLDADVATVTLDPLQHLLVAPLANMPGEAEKLVELAATRLLTAHDGRHPGLKPGGGLNVETSESQRALVVKQANRAEIAARILGAIPNLEHLPVEEVLDIRGAVAPNLARFRAAVAELECLLDSSAEGSDVWDAIDDVRLSKVEPELEELRETLRSNGVTATALRSAKYTSVGAVTLGVTAVVGGPLLAGAVLLGAGVASAVVSELTHRAEAEAERRKHRLFLVFDAERRAAR